MSVIEVKISAPNKWAEIAKAIDGADISISDAFYIARAVMETALVNMDRDVQRVVWLAFERALAERCPAILEDLL